MNIINESESDPVIGCVIDCNGGIHAIRGLDDIMEIAERVHPELDSLWKNEWEPQELEYPDEMMDYILEKGWIEMLDKERPRVTFEKPTPQALQSFYRVATDMGHENFLLQGVGKRAEHVSQVHLAITKMGG